MGTAICLEICVESLDHALAAQTGGADRIELCQDLSCGGVTPSTALVRAVRAQLQIPICGMIRPRPGDFCYSESEFEIMKREIGVARELGLDGLVLGILDPTGQVDRDRTTALVHLADPLPVTFHRAFDLCPDLNAALEAVIETGAKRILTSGGKPSLMDGLAEVTHLLQAAQRRVVIMPGGGIRSANIEGILRSTDAQEIHTSLDGSAQRPDDSFEERVRRFRYIVDKISSTAPHDASYARRIEG